MEKDIGQVEARFGSSVASYFVFFRWIVLIHVVASLPASVLQLNHISSLLHKKDFKDWTKLQGFTPWVILISSFEPPEAEEYSVRHMRVYDGWMNQS